MSDAQRSLKAISFSWPIFGAIQSVKVTIGGELGEELAWNFINCSWTDHALLEDGICSCGAVFPEEDRE